MGENPKVTQRLAQRNECLIEQPAMTNDLFPDCKQDSPRLAWMKRHDISVRQMTDFEHCLFAGRFAALKKLDNEYFQTGIGETEDEAISSLAEQLGIPPWNEEAYINEHKRSTIGR